MQVTIGLDDLGINRDQSSRWQRLAIMSEKVDETQSHMMLLGCDERIWTSVRHDAPAAGNAPREEISRHAARCDR
jgi:hypothetical protein